MKHVKKIALWIFISLFAQSSVLYYLDKFYFVNEKTFVDKVVTKPKAEDKKIEIKIPDEAKDVKLSYEGKYVSYFDGTSVKVINTTTGEIKEVVAQENSKISFYKWFPDRNTIITAEKSSSKQGDIFSLYTYEAAKDYKKLIRNDHNNKETQIPATDKESEVEDIQLSTMTNLIYVKVSLKGNRNTIYSIDVMADMEREKTSNSYFIGKLLISRLDDKIIYEDLNSPKSPKIYVKGNKNPLSIKDVGVPCLIGIDKDDKLYIGQVEGEKVKRIYSGNIKDTTDKWKITELKTPTDKKNIFVSTEGNIYVNDNLKGEVNELISGKNVSYEGEFIGLYDKGITSKVDGILIKTPFNKSK